MRLESRQSSSGRGKSGFADRFVSREGIESSSNIGASSLISPIRFLLIAFVILTLSAVCSAQTSAFTYQGQLSSEGAPATGDFDFQFTIYDAASDGASLAGPLSASAVPVTNGVFTVTLNPGAGVFTGAERWLEIAVRANGSPSAHTILMPRQQFAAAPYAMFALATAPQPVNLPSGVSISSASASDTGLLGQGYQQFASVPAPVWSNGGSDNQPSPRYRHSTIWTGQEMFVWGGNLSAGSYSAAGGLYRPDTGQWTTTSTIDAPAARSDHSGVWTGQTMIIWGGFGANGYLDTGGRYDPASQTWSTVTIMDFPRARSGHSAIWNGSRMIIWGGQDGGGLLNDGGLYDPVAEFWGILPQSNRPEARKNASAVWAGDRFLIWGGEGDSGELNTGARLIFDGGGVPQAWQSISLVNAPSARSGHAAVWTGSRMIIWGGRRAGTFLNDGASYDPIADTWTALPAVSAPGGRADSGAVWTGSEALVWGGEGAAGSLASGGAYNPATDAWRLLSNGGGPIARSGAGTVWSGSELLVYGGRSNGSPVAALQRVNPQPTWYFYRKP
ncbi:MAG: hypothetical protein ACI8QF_002239 [Limisphaerales bacterium]|jgi:hypothetical protein